MISLEDALKKTAAELPNGSVVLLSVERGSLCVGGYNWFGDAPDIDTDGMSVVEKLLATLKWCRDTSPKVDGGNDENHCS